MVSRLPVRSLRFEPLPTNLGRRLLVADFEGGLRVTTAHFESMPAGRPVRVAQLQKAFPLLTGRASVLTGDFNFGDLDTTEKAAMQPDFVDLWPALHPGDPGYTRDTLANPMGSRAQSSRQERLDKILIHRLNPQSIQRLGTEPTGAALYPSDHFGLLAHIERDSS